MEQKAHACRAGRNARRTASGFRNERPDWPRRRVCSYWKLEAVPWTGQSRPITPTVRIEPALLKGWTPPLKGIRTCQGGVVMTHHLKEEASSGRHYHHRNRSGETEVFGFNGARADGSVAFRKKLSRSKVLGFVASQPRSEIPSFRIPWSANWHIASCFCHPDATWL